MRTIHELLILLRDNIIIHKSWFGLKQRIANGLCLEASWLQHNEGKINYMEYCELVNYITSNRPIYWRSKSYGWKPKLWKPRLKWLNKHIKLTK